MCDYHLKKVQGLLVCQGFPQKGNRVCVKHLDDWCWSSDPFSFWLKLKNKKGQLCAGGSAFKCFSFRYNEPMYHGILFQYNSEAGGNKSDPGMNSV